MKLEQKVKPYKKVDGIYGEEEPTKWQKFCYEVGRFFAGSIAGHWEIKWTWKL